MAVARVASASLRAGGRVAAAARAAASDGGGDAKNALSASETAFGSRSDDGGVLATTAAAARRDAEAVTAGRRGGAVMRGGELTRAVGDDGEIKCPCRRGGRRRSTTKMLFAVPAALCSRDAGHRCCWPVETAASTGNSSSSCCCCSLDGRGAVQRSIDAFAKQETGGKERKE